MTTTLALFLAMQVATAPTPPDQTAGPQVAPEAGQAQPSPVQAEAAQAEPATPDDDQAATGRLGTAQQGGGDIVVTARRRAESVQSVPIAISVIGGTALAETGAYNVNRLTNGGTLGFAHSGS